MPSPDQLAELQNPLMLKEFLKDVKTSEIQLKLDSIKKEHPEIEVRPSPQAFLSGIANLRKTAGY